VLLSELKGSADQLSQEVDSGGGVATGRETG